MKDQGKVLRSDRGELLVFIGDIEDRVSIVG